MLYILELEIDLHLLQIYGFSYWSYPAGISLISRVQALMLKLESLTLDIKINTSRLTILLTPEYVDFSLIKYLILCGFA